MHMEVTNSGSKFRIVVFISVNSCFNSDLGSEVSKTFFPGNKASS